MNYDSVDAPAGTAAQIKVGDTVIESFSAAGLPADEAKAKTDALNKALGDAITAPAIPAPPTRRRSTTR